jgi:hypothetical protein
LTKSSANSNKTAQQWMWKLGDCQKRHSKGVY